MLCALQNYWFSVPSVFRLTSGGLSTVRGCDTSNDFEPLRLSICAIPAPSGPTVRSKLFSPVRYSLRCTSPAGDELISCIESSFDKQNREHDPNHNHNRQHYIQKQCCGDEELCCWSRLIVLALCCCNQLLDVVHSGFTTRRRLVRRACRRGLPHLRKDHVHLVQNLLRDLLVVLFRALADHEALDQRYEYRDERPRKQHIRDTQTPLAEVKAMGAHSAQQQRQYQCC